MDAGAAHENNRGEPMPNGVLFVDYIMPDGSTRPALVVRDWTAACASIQVFPDRVNDGPDPLGFEWFRSSCSVGYTPGAWRHRPFVFSGVVGQPVEIVNVNGGGAIPAGTFVSCLQPTAVPLSVPNPHPNAVPYSQPTGGYPR
jgi:hypothetical protein